ncbi:helix-turn-helix domain-containing protein [Vibrio rumoiensis]|uniref:L-threonine 3-dehydrogenase n=1 Tax=Vibrio rumoiensis 1S-45 TaxID=1188252 RepID=A0A1E5E4T7_9VIBR|nr:helix-turn-helix transcriptional regulator [Vibrio rumoiensis]OEF28128.1 L-threonine 3-dehydrogenase [Vibrio rumoiensis 1S-45]
MEFTEQDREVLYNLWMSQKAKRHLTQMDMAKRLGVGIVEFSEMIRGKGQLTTSFVTRFFQQLDIEPHTILPSLKRQVSPDNAVVYLQNRIIIDGDIQNVQVDGNQVIIDYCCKVAKLNTSKSTEK